MNRIAQRKAQRKANRMGTQVERFAAKEAQFESALSEVRSKLAKAPDRQVVPKAASSSSVHKVRIEPGKQSVIYLQTPGDSAHQSTFSFCEAASFLRTALRLSPSTQFLWIP
jgi:hypothetical protein